MRKLIGTVAVWAAMFHLLVLLAYLGATASVGERCWLLDLLLYLPRWYWGLPTLVLAPVLALAGPRRTLLVVALAAAIVLFPLMGLKPPSRPSFVQSASLRVLSYNVWRGQGGVEAIRREVDAAQPDVVLLQVSSGRVDAAFETGRFQGWFRSSHLHFTIVSRFPIRDVWVPDGLGPDAGPAFVRYQVETPIGLLDMYNVHLASPRAALYAVRDRIKAALQGHSQGLLEGAERELRSDVARREREIRALAGALERSVHPVIVAGDFNLPGLSILLRYLHGYSDAFLDAGAGFGYTFPAGGPRPWMRIDRIFAGSGLRFAGFQVVGGTGSEHCPVVADVVRATPQPGPRAERVRGSGIVVWLLSALLVRYHPPTRRGNGEHVGRAGA